MPWMTCADSSSDRIRLCLASAEGWYRTATVTVVRVHVRLISRGPLPASTAWDANSLAASCTVASARNACSRHRSVSTNSRASLGASTDRIKVRARAICSSSAPQALAGWSRPISFR
jgi:hypothetical protein